MIVLQHPFLGCIRDVFRAIAHPARRKLLQLLRGKELPVVAIAERMPLSRTAVNKHLQVLSDAGLVSRRRAGRETRYTLRPAPLDEVKAWLAFFDPYWDGRLARLKQWVEADPGGDEGRPNCADLEVGPWQGRQSPIVPSAIGSRRWTGC